MLEASHIAVDHGKLRALWDISLAVGEGQRLGLVGMNGAGKSTTLGTIAGLYQIAGGSITYAGAPLGQQSPPDAIERGIVLVPEGRRLFPEMSVRENLMMGAYTQSARGRLSQSIDSVLTLFPILHQKLAQPARELSGGQQQMVAIGRALMASPRLLLLDEPFIGVAPILVEEIMAALTAITENGVTMILVDQNIRRAMRFAERVTVIENGRTVLEGSGEDLLDNKQFATTFLGLD